VFLWPLTVACQEGAAERDKVHIDAALGNDGAQQFCLLFFAQLIRRLQTWHLVHCYAVSTTENLVQDGDNASSEEARKSNDSDDDDEEALGATSAGFKVLLQTSRSWHSRTLGIFYKT
jgi:hypothetical protein